MDVQLYRKVTLELVPENMETKGKTIISVLAKIDAPLEKVWKFWTTSEDIINWNNASDDWHTTRAENDLQVGGKFNYRMEAKDGSAGFDFEGIYDQVVTHQLIEYTIVDGRKVKIVLSSLDYNTEVIETFEAESENSIEMQRGGWQAILDNFKLYAEAKK
jgi:uncharacterized protein YndB with AHSA1/START domain